MSHPARLVVGFIETLVPLAGAAALADREVVWMTSATRPSTQLSRTRPAGFAPPP